MTRAHRLLLTACVLLATLALFASACGDDGRAAPALGQPDMTGRALTDEFMTLLQDKDAAGLDAYLSEAFIIQRADGSSATKADYLTRLPEIGDYTIEAVTTRQAGDALTVKWALVVDQVINGQTYSARQAPRLSTFAWDADARRWRMTGHANFNVPAEAITGN